MKKYAFTNGIILDGTKDMEPVLGKTIFVEGKKIIKIANDSESTEGYEVVDLSGHYIMPGLINLHVHIPATGKPKKKASDPKKAVNLITSCAPLRAIGKSMCRGYAKTEFLSGVTTFRSVGGILNWDSVIRDEILSGKKIGSRIIAGNMAVSVPGGHMAGSLGYEAHSAEEAVNLVEQIAKGKADLIKLMITGGVLDATKKGEPGILKMPAEYVKAACGKAHSLGLKVAAHVESPEGIKVALENGVDTIEHGAKPDSQIISLFKEKKAVLVSTLSPAISYALFPREISGASDMEQYNGKVVFDGIVDCAKACLENGVTVGLGTDTGCPYVTHYNMWMELQLFHKYCGVSNSFALHTATEINAKIAGIDNITGTIAEGKEADLIVTCENPLEDLSALSNISMVMGQGNLILNPKVKKMEQVEKEMVKYL